MRALPAVPAVNGRPQPVPVVVQAAAPPRSALALALQGLVLLLLLSLVAVVLFLVMALASLLNLPTQVASGVGSRLEATTQEAGRALAGAGEALRNATDPARPPVGLVYDVEFSALRTVQVGETLPGGTDYVLAAREIRRREGAGGPDIALYLVVQAQLRQPRETRLLGQLIRTDADPREHVLYKGESFRIGRALYRVNWISLEQRAVGIATYRQPDDVTAVLKFAYD